ncbi:AzlD domain-containing protein [Alkalicoccus saliphilus]|jgi:branched-subunit amino acid transport protein|uniref:Branched-chain amino acid transporter n=1 Tax=Alkalicoccus saliphilus TaxID=200989 RepID=A0A2T4U4C9_9BACI|nr:AzlD domain-containing protein [Alkalicoccus saliphilus]PTL38229.1 branched-chain amino acid transporter [Alkalicoccus saliphilus]
MNEAVVWMIIGMGIVTYIPRILPLLMLSTENWPSWLRRMLARVPYAVLGALIFPGIIFAYDAVWYGLLGGAAAFLIAYTGAPLIAVVAGTILLLTGINLMM